MSAHTSGPWTVRQGSEARDFIVAEPTGNTICEPNIEMFGSPNDFDPSVRRIPLAEALANARLIAAAPELLQALKAIMRHVESEFRLSGDRWATSIKADAEAAETAIAKAEPLPVPAWNGSDRRSGNGVEHAARDERRDTTKDRS